MGASSKTSSAPPAMCRCAVATRDQSRSHEMQLDAFIGRAAPESAARHRTILALKAERKATHGVSHSTTCPKKNASNA